jgi:hypothetical protein
MRKLIFLSIFLFIISGYCFAEEQISKDWIWDLSEHDYAYAATGNREGSVLGQFCYYSNGSCVYMVDLGIACQPDNEYPSILNSDAGVAEVRLVCSELSQGKYVFFVTPFDYVDNIVKQADNVGFAVAMEEGVFKVVRFSLSGSNHAIQMMRIGAEMLNGVKAEKETNFKNEEYL